MKALVAALTLAIILGGQIAASANTSEEDDLKKKQKREILSSEQDKLFKEGKLAETIVKPIYSSTDQLINIELIKKTTKDLEKGK
jgi:hypothetical protein